MGILRRDDEGEAVRQVQATLQAWGVPIGDPPGRFGLWTEAAIYALQRAEGLEADGAVGPHTAARLAGAVPASFAAAPVSTLTCIEGVPYRTQRDNVHAPGGTCNVTALAMALLYHGAQPLRPAEQFEDELYELLNGPEGMEYYRGHDAPTLREGFPPNEAFDMLVWAAQRYGADASFSTARSLADIEGEIDAGRPVVISGHFTGSGHIVLLVGLTAAGDFICHDPYGDWLRGYQSRDGAARIYPRERVLSVLKDPHTDNKWGLFLSRRQAPQAG